ncbi:SusC/RagA family TonB-linked outer membrane protein [Flavivirga eckloniae]|uniref:SusC/RagA family TonB-linked outer membrane protein n=1 Tax=Flavivirga eckloniae TaxID=1803846 RepID=A0A2K9PSQ1_9FLAO|nr:SusC/RagA family TonB-linked outer membrane protein [Flavivirga eckloniae]AUP80086.1 SusC/RagA family TonB-linked outer membrane protein [Flavivirga eckloniae]
MCKKLLNFLAFVFLLSSSVIQAQSIRVSGTVTDGNGIPLPGVNVLEKGTNNGTSADFDGGYSISVNGSAVLVFSSIGFVTQEVTVGAQTVINVSLVESVQALDEIVVTALGIKREKKALGYSMQEVSSETVTAAANGNINTALQGKVAGVNITTSGGIGGNARVDLRGTSSLNGNDEILWVIDGVPFSADDTSDPDDLFGGISNGGGLLDINPDDIETVSVLKGGQAAALYGSRGANGVVLITTKSGKKTEGLGISYTGSTVFSEASYFLDLQNEYGQGLNGNYDPTSGAAWGPRFDGVSRPSWTGEQLPYEAASDQLDDFTRTAISMRHALSLSKASEEGNFRVSIAKDKTEGVFENNQIDKLNFDVKAAYDINSWLNVDTKISYIKNKGQQRPEVGNYSYVSFFNRMPANIRTQDLSPGFVIVNGERAEYLYGSSTDLTANPNANNRNPYFIQDQIFNSDTRNRFFGYFASTFKFTDDLKLKLKYGLDTYRYEALDGYRYPDNASDQRPNFNTSEKFYSEENMEFLLSYNKDLSEKINFGLSVGGNKMHRESQLLRSTSGKLASSNDFFLNAGTTLNTNESFSQREIQSVYGYLDVSYNDYLFLTATARNDWSSALPIDNNSYFYPSVGLSALISEMATMPDWISYLKLRGSWAQVGKDTQPYLANPVFSFSTWNFNLLTSGVPQGLVDPNLKPEISTTSEVGLELKLFKSRFGIDITYYNERTKNQIVNTANGQSSGYDLFLTNLGLISNKGLEIIANIVPVKTEDFNMGLTLNFAKNKGVLEEFDKSLDGEDLPYFFFNSNTIPEQVRAEVGRKMGDIYGFAFERDAEGQFVIGADGLPTRSADVVKLGNIQPDFTGSIGIDLNYKNVSLNALLGMQQGGDIYSLTEAGATGSGTAARTTSLGREPFFVPGNLSDGSPNLTIVSPQQYWSRVAGVTESSIYDASFMKLTELALGYSIPRKVLDKLGNGVINRAKFSLVGRNLFYLYRNTPGTVPDSGVYNTSFGAQAFDFSPVPVTRSVGFSLNLNF